MAKLPVEENDASRQRLARLVEATSHITEGDLPEGDRAVAQALARLAFWDRWAEQLLIRWRSGGMPPPAVPDWYDDAINDALSDQWRALPVDVAGRLAVEAAKAVDREISRIETPVDAALTASGQTRLLQRYRFRNAALDIIEQSHRQDAA
jgi:hypothetical protein